MLLNLRITGWNIRDAIASFAHISGDLVLVTCFLVYYASVYHFSTPVDFGFESVCMLWNAYGFSIGWEWVNYVEGGPPYNVTILFLSAQKTQNKLIKKLWGTLGIFSWEFFMRLRTCCKVSSTVEAVCLCNSRNSSSSLFHIYIPQVVRNPAIRCCCEEMVCSLEKRPTNFWLVKLTL